MNADDLLDRIDRLESAREIEQLAIRYALAVDGRDLDGWVGLFVADVDCGRHGKGREALRTVIEPQMRLFYRSIHLICGHRVEFEGRDGASGIVYCRAEHEVGGRWPVMAIAYFDQYARRDGIWYFVRRREKHWYGIDALERPGPPFGRWPEDAAECRLPGDFEHWSEFWEGVPDDVMARLTSHKAGGKS